MNSIHIESTKSSPAVAYDASGKVLKIEGQSYPEYALKFYDPVFNWIKNSFDTDSSLTVEIYLSYMNTSSSRCIMEIVDILEEAFEKGKKASIRWIYDQENEYALEMAEEFKEGMNLPFVIEKKLPGSQD